MLGQVQVELFIAPINIIYLYNDRDFRTWVGCRLRLSGVHCQQATVGDLAGI
jgi:hypothetical protein